MDNASILIVTSNRTLRRRVTRAVGSIGATVSHCSMDRVEIQRHLGQPCDMYIVDADAESQTVLFLLGELYERRRDAITLILSHELESDFMRELLVDRGVNNLIAKHGGVTAVQELIDENELIITVNKLLSKDIFGIDKYLPTWGININHHRIGSKEDKLKGITMFEEFLDMVDCYSGIAPVILTVADELLMNAIYNAPVNSDGKSKYAQLERRRPLVLDPNEQVDFRYACDGRYIALSVTDPFGSLKREVLVRYLTRVRPGQKADIEEKDGGAGLGFHVVFQSITQLVFNIEVGVKTEVIAFFYVRSGTRVFKESGQSLNIFLAQ